MSTRPSTTSKPAEGSRLGGPRRLYDRRPVSYYRVGEAIGFPMQERFPGWTAITERVMARGAVQRVLKKESVSGP
jgi:hypothetical protein